MKTVTPKIAILESLSEMDNLQAQKVLEYIKSMIFTKENSDYSRFKREALREIRQALKDTGAGMVA